MARSVVNQCCLAEQIRDALADRIAEGKYPAGHRLVELSLAKEFGTSQAPIREALRLLEGMRLVESASRRGTRVRDLSGHVLWEAAVVRASLERAAAETGAAEHYAAHSDAVEQLRSINAALAKHAAKRDARRVADRNAEFHRCIVEASENKTLAETWATFALEPMGRICMAKAGVDFKNIVREHDAIIDALAAGHGPTAGQLLWEHAMKVAHASHCKTEGQS